MVVLLLAGACSGSSPPTAAHVPRSTTSTPGAALRHAITATATALSRILDEDVSGNGDLLVPQNRYNEDIEKLAVATAATEAAVAGAPLSAQHAAEVGRWLAETSSLVPQLQQSAAAALTALQAAVSEMAVVQRDLGLAP